MTKTYTRIAGDGDNVICLHASLSSSRQWQDLMQRLQHRYRVSAPDLHGYGYGPDLTSSQAPTLEREVELVAELVEDMKGPVHLVGHSYGGVVAIRAARILGDRISSLSLYEPVIFAALLAANPIHFGSAEISRVIEEIHDDFSRGDLFHAARRFVEYWSGAGAWGAIPVQKQFALAARIPAVIANFEAVLSQPDPVEDLAQLRLPTLYLSGAESPASMRAILELVKREWSHAIRHRFTDMGHMGPVTHAETVNARIERFIRQCVATDRRKAYAQAA